MSILLLLIFRSAAILHVLEVIFDKKVIFTPPLRSFSPLRRFTSMIKWKKLHFTLKTMSLWLSEYSNHQNYLALLLQVEYHLAVVEQGHHHQSRFSPYF